MSPKTLLLSIYLSLAYWQAVSQPTSIQWEKSFGGSQLDHAKWAQKTSDSGYIICGYTRSTDGDILGNHGPENTQQDALLLKLDKHGKLQWQKAFGGTKDDELTYIHQTNDGGYITTGFVNSIDGDLLPISANYHGNGDVWVMKIKPDGTIEWQAVYGGTKDEVAYDIELTNDGGYILAGYTTSTDGDISHNHGGQDYWVVKLDAVGHITWQKTFGNSANNIANSIKQTYDGGYIIGGISNCVPGDTTMAGQHANNDCWVIKLNATGQQEWQRAYGGSNAEGVKTIIQTRDSSYLITGQTNSSDGDVTNLHGTTGSDIWVCNIGQDGNLKWQKTFGGTGSEGSRSIMQCRDGGFLIGGLAGSVDGDLALAKSNTADYWLLKLDEHGEMIWNYTAGGLGTDDAACALETFDGGYLIAGDAGRAGNDISFSHGGDDIWVVKLTNQQIPAGNNCGNMRTFPNPCDTRLQVNLSAAQAQAKLQLINALGQSILTDNDPGMYRTINTTTVRDGLYFLMITTEDGTTCTTKIVVAH